jgi:hypothetical protein
LQQLSATQLYQISVWKVNHTRLIVQLPRPIHLLFKPLNK